MSLRACFSTAMRSSLFSASVLDAFDGGGDALAELGGLGAEGLVGECLNGRLEVIDLLHDRHEALDGAFVAGAKDFS